MLPVRNITRSLVSRFGCDVDRSEFIDRPGDAGGEPGGPDVGDAGGAGAGGFCGKATGTKRRNSRAVLAKTRKWALKVVYLIQTKRKELMRMSLGVGKVQVNLNCPYGS